MSFGDYSRTRALNTALGDDLYIGPNMERGKVRPSLQQLAADGRELYDTVQSAIDITQGEPGVPGNIVSTYPKSAIGSLRYLMEYLSAFQQGVTAGTQQYDFGSSVGNGAALGASAAANNPGAYFHTRLKASLDKLTIFNFSRTNGSVDGSALNEMVDVFRDDIVPSGAKVSFGVPGMNDFQIPSFNTGQTFDSEFGARKFLRQILTLAQKSRISVVLSTSPHPCLPRMDYGFFADNPAIPQGYPTAVSAPVPAGSVVPTAANSTQTITWKGSPILVDVRFLRGNQMIREEAALFGVAVIDAEAKQFDMLKAGVTYEEMFDTGEVVHPNLATIQATYHAAIDEFFAGIENDFVLTYAPAPTAGYLGLNVSAQGAYAVRWKPPVGSGDALLRVDLEDATSALEIDEDGNVDQKQGDTFKIGPQLTRRTGLDPGLGTPKNGYIGEISAVAKSFTMPTNSAAFVYAYGIGGDGRVYSAAWMVASNGTTAVIGATLSPVEIGAGGTTFTLSAVGLVVTMTPGSAGSYKLNYQTL